ncbi:MAG: hypothetical protein AB1896_19960 [Thermodesulfobacteriota bacterium]
MTVDESLWRFMEEHLGYNDEEKELFRKNPRNEEVLAKGAALMGKTLVFEVVESHGCNSGHRPGDRILFDGAGNLLTRLAPKRICAYALSCLAPLILAANEMIYAGADPNRIFFKRVGCPDVGVRCGGWGRVVFEFKVEDREGKKG